MDDSAPIPTAVSDCSWGGPWVLWMTMGQRTMNYCGEQFLAMQQGALRRDNNRAEDKMEMRMTMMGMGHQQ